MPRTSSRQNWVASRAQFRVTSSDVGIIVDGGVPSDSLGVDGDSYIDSSTRKFYHKENGHWMQIGGLVQMGAQTIPFNQFLWPNPTPPARALI